LKAHKNKHLANKVEPSIGKGDPG